MTVNLPHSIAAYFEAARHGGPDAVAAAFDTAMHARSQQRKVLQRFLSVPEVQHRLLRSRAAGSAPGGRA